MKRYFAFFCLMFCFLFAYEEEELVGGLTRTDSIPNESVEETPDSYFEGYLQALIDMHYYEYKVVVLVHNKVVWLANMPKNDLLSKSIVFFIKDVPGVCEVKVLNGVPPKIIEDREKYDEYSKSLQKDSRLFSFYDQEKGAIEMIKNLIIKAIN